MCGIIGLLVRDPDLESELGVLVPPRRAPMGARGSDSTGVAFYRPPDPGRHRISLHRSDPALSWEVVAVADADATLTSEQDAALLSTPAPLDSAVASLRALAPGFQVAGFGRAVEVVKDVGTGEAVCRRYHLD